MPELKKRFSIFYTKAKISENPVKEKKMEKSTKKYTKIEMTNYTKYPDNVFINCAFVFEKIC